MHLDPPRFRLESGLALWLSLDWQTEKEVILLNFQGWVIGTLEGSIAISRNICSRESKAACKKPDYPEIAKLWLTDGEVAWRDTQPTLRCPRYLSPYKWRNHLGHFSPSRCHEKYQGIKPEPRFKTYGPSWASQSPPSIWATHIWGIKLCGAEISHPSPMCPTWNPNP